jgi:hypothetical protein
LDGVDQLKRLLVDVVGYPSVAAAVAEHTVFLHPKTVKQTYGRGVFPIIRYRGDRDTRGNRVTDREGRAAILDDNTTPREVFLRSACRSKGRNAHFSHVWDDTGSDLDAYTALWNVCAVPAFLAKTTDGKNHPEVRHALWYRSYELYRMTPAGVERPSKPNGYDSLEWAEAPEPVSDLGAVLRAWLSRCRASRAAKAAREIGWLFSDWKPDPMIPAPNRASSAPSGAARSPL